jgi:hypothetical protein
VTGRTEDGTKGSASGSYSDAEVARIVFDALQRANPRALLSGDPTDRLSVLVDGSFNFRMVAKHLKARLGIKGKPSKRESECPRASAS